MRACDQCKADLGLFDPMTLWGRDHEGEEVWLCVMCTKERRMEKLVAENQALLEENAELRARLGETP